MRGVDQYGVRTSAGAPTIASVLTEIHPRDGERGRDRREAFGR